VKIALDAGYSLDDNPSGIGVYSRRLLYGLAEAHPEADFLWAYRPHRWRRALGESLPENCRRRLLYGPFGPRAADLFHGLNQRLPRMRLRHKIATFHDLFVMTGEYSTPEFRRRFTEQAKQAAAESHAIIAVSAFTARQVQQLLGVEPGRIHVVHHGVNVPAVQGGVREKVILHVGAIQHRKNLGRLVKAFEQVPPEWRLVLAGSRGFGADAILRAIETSPAAGRIEVAGYVTSAILAAWYGRASVFAFPSLDEGFGMPVLEAMAAGVPVLTSDRSALPEVAGDAALLVNPEEVGALTEALQRLTSDGELRERLIERGKQRALEFSWAATVAGTWAVYQELLSAARHPQQS